MAGFVESFTNGAVTARDVLFLVPEVLFLAFMVVAALNATLGGLVTSTTLGGGRYRSIDEEHGGSGRACFKGMPVVPLAAAGVAAVVATMVIPAVAASLKVVLQAPVAAVAMAVATAALMVGLAIVALVMVLLMLAVGVGFSATTLARVYGRLKGRNQQVRKQGYVSRRYGYSNIRQ